MAFHVFYTGDYLKTDHICTITLKRGDFKGKRRINTRVFRNYLFG